MASDVPVTFISVGNNFQDDNIQWFLVIIDALLAESAPLQVLTTNYGMIPLVWNIDYKYGG